MEYTYPVINFNSSASANANTINVAGFTSDYNVSWANTYINNTIYNSSSYTVTDTTTVKFTLDVPVTKLNVDINSGLIDNATTVLKYSDGTTIATLSGMTSFTFYIPTCAIVYLTVRPKSDTAQYYYYTTTSGRI